MSQLKINDGNGNWIPIPAGGIGVPSGGTQGQVLTKSSATDYATEWALPLSMKLLWTNPSPTSAFAAQTISVDLSAYDFVCILYYDSASSEQTSRSFFANVGMNGMLDCTQSHIFRRSATVNTSGVVFGSGSFMGSYPNASMSNNNNFCIPYKIYGIKGVQ